jgi:TetR/AcrR family transcriptional regulator
METQKPDNRTNILNMALDLFAVKGYESVGVQEIADQAGISKPTLYHYFGNKRGLLDAIIASWGGKMYAVIDTGAQYNHDIVMNLTVLTRGMISYALANQAFYRFHLALSASAPENAGYTAYLPLRTSINASGDHGNMRGREKSYSETFQGMVRTWAMLVLNKEAELTDDMLFRAVHQFMHGIFS